jgi:PAS domain S-box-containing protein/TyrR family helix-turn-helix protein
MAVDTAVALRIRDLSHFFKPVVVWGKEDTLDRVVSRMVEESIPFASRCVPQENMVRLWRLKDLWQFMGTETSWEVLEQTAEMAPLVNLYDSVRQVLVHHGSEERLVICREGKPFAVLETKEIQGILSLVDNIFKYFYATIDAMHNPVVAIDNRGKIIVWNKAFAAITGKSAPEVIGHDVCTVVHSTKLLSVVKSGFSYVLDKFTLGDHTFLATRTPIVIDGRIVGAVSLLQDISELETISRELTTTQNLVRELRAILDSSTNGIFVTDGHGNVVMVNKAYETMTGITEAEVLGKNMADLVREGYYDESVTMKVLKSRKRETLVQEVKGGKTTLLVTGNPVFDENGNLFRVVTTVQDVTDIRRMQEELEYLLKLKSAYEHQFYRWHRNHLEGRLVFRSKVMEQTVDLALRVAQFDSTVLITGESGVGKELIADLIHAHSRRANKPFLKINCAAIPENLLETELFGYEEGAFSGARRGGKPGLFEICEGGALFLDEIGELSLPLQVKLLRVLQNKEIIRVGGVKPIEVDVRIIAATNRDLGSMVAMGQFRRDLYYRLNVVPISVPPLRERKEDIPHLVLHFVDQFNKRFGVRKEISREVIHELQNYNWPGNIRELENVIERVMVISSRDLITADDVRFCLASASGNSETTVNSYRTTLKPLKEAVSEFERDILQAAFERYRSSRQVAKVLKIDQSTVIRKAMKYGITWENKNCN